MGHYPLCGKCGGHIVNEDVYFIGYVCRCDEVAKMKRLRKKKKEEDKVLRPKNEKEEEALEGLEDFTLYIGFDK